MAETSLPRIAPLRLQLVAETLGTFALVLVGTGAIAAAEEHGWFGDLGICLAFGAVVTTVVLAIGNVSGAHINPAVTIGFAAAGRFDRRRVLPFIGAQLLGALLASLSVRALVPSSDGLGATLPAVGWAGSFGLELGLTFVLMFVILWVSAHPRTTLPIAAGTIGLVVMTLGYFCGPFSGASMNPARSFGPALVSGGLGPLPLYFAAPILGALLAVPLCRLRSDPNCCPDKSCP